MKVNKEIRSGNERVDKYIVSLEDYLLTLEASNIMKLIKACDEASGVMADDVRILTTENDEEIMESKLVMLGSKKNKRFDAFLSLVKSVKDLKGISDMMNDLKPQIEANEVKKEESKQEEAPTLKKKKTNIQDFVVESYGP